MSDRGFFGLPTEEEQNQVGRELGRGGRAGWEGITDSEGPLRNPGEIGGIKGVPDTMMGVANSGNPSVLAKWNERLAGYEFGCAEKDGHTENHKGVDIAAEPGTPVKAWYQGEVQFKARNNAVNGDWITIYYPSVDATIAAMHLMGGSLTSKERVNKGDVIGEIGTRADANGTDPHVHYQALPGKVSTPSRQDRCNAVNPNPFYDGKKAERGGGAGDAMSSIADSIQNLPRLLSQGIVAGVVGVFKWLFGKLILVPYDWLSGFSYNFLNNMWEGFTDTDASRPAFGPYNRQRLYLIGLGVLTYQLVWGTNADGQGRLGQSIEQIGNGVNRTLGEQSGYRTRTPQSVDFEADYMGATTSKVNRGQTVTVKANKVRR